MDKYKVLLVSLFLISTIAASTITLPDVAAHNPPSKIPTYAFISVSPNPVGAGQTTTVILWLDITIIGAGVTNNIRFHNYELTITKPDGTTETKTWPIVSDTTSQALLYTHPSGQLHSRVPLSGQTYMD
jgi:hypothetical protein